MVDIIRADFKLVSQWSVEENGEKFQNCCPSHGGQPKWLIDGSTGRKYLNESKGCVRTKCILLTLGTPLYHSIAAMAMVVSKIFRVITFANFWLPKEGDGYNFKGRLKDVGKDVAGIFLLPLAIVGLELSNIYGWISPYNGRKLYASIERVFFGGPDLALAPCFQPDPQSHAFGGDIDIRDQF